MGVVTTRLEAKTVPLPSPRAAISIVPPVTVVEGPSQPLKVSHSFLTSTAAFSVGLPALVTLPVIVEPVHVFRKRPGVDSRRAEVPDLRWKLI